MRELLQEGVCCTYTIHREIKKDSVIYELEIIPYGMEITRKNYGLRLEVNEHDYSDIGLDKLDVELREGLMSSVVDFFKNAAQYSEEFNGG